MLFTEIREGMRVMDSWFSYYGVGTVTKVRKASVKVNFPHQKEDMTYDRPHCQFLKQFYGEKP